ncbi:hypothetical protein [Chryseobacterium viscerum]|uniref:hypothetical protein n=1 Tax=Chryseobacterium viscerum TaxID=1037377 RepID=UPI0022221EB3|nr:hypothetical protein [Chryseobacterium viscerum]MCW1960744.1 hypothetical protein [Chryseobacterium viscerum]
MDVVSKGNTDTTKALKINDNSNKELLSISDVGTVRLDNYKNYSFLGTDANGYLKDGAALNIPSISTIANRNITTGTVAGAVSSNLSFTINKNNAELISSNGTTFTIKKAGYYSITVYTHYDISMNNPSGGSASTNIYKGANSIATTLTGHGDGTDSIGHSTTITQYFNINETFHINVQYTRTYRCDRASLNVVYYGT